jgi:hypothetical protein
MPGDPNPFPEEPGDADSWDPKLARAARELHQEWDSPSLWPRIRQAIEERHAKRPRLAGWFHGWRPVAAAAALLVLIAGAGVWTSRSPETAAPATQASRVFLTEQALREAEQAEQAYIRSIDRLQQLAEPGLQQPGSPLMANYREKLRELDAAIAELRDTVDDNRFHAQLRMELASLYQEKQRTLEEVLKYASN